MVHKKAAPEYPALPLFLYAYNRRIGYQAA